MDTNESGAVLETGIGPSQRVELLARLTGLRRELAGIVDCLRSQGEAIARLESELGKPAPGRARLVAPRILRIDTVEYVISTVPGSSRIKLGYAKGGDIAMWDNQASDPWVLALEDFEVFRRSGHAGAAHELLVEVDRARRPSRRG